MKILIYLLILFFIGFVVSVLFLSEALQFIFSTLMFATVFVYVVKVGWKKEGKSND